MADFGADVINVEHPRGDSVRKMGWHRENESLWWVFLGRNKRCVTLDLHTPEGQQLLRELAAGADILVENFRPGVMESWGLGPDNLADVNPRLIIVRTTGFGQTGPYSHRAGFGTLAEAMSGFCHINGYPDGAPTLPPFALADGIAALFGTFAAMFAIYARDVRHAGEGQVIDLSLYEPLFWLLGPQTTVYDQLGIVQHRTGNRAPFTSPRNMYLSKDGKWLALSASSQSIAERVMILCGRSDLIKEPWFADHEGRLQHQDELDSVIGAWIGQRAWRDVVDAFSEAEAAIAPVYSIEDIFADSQFDARQSIMVTEHPTLGRVKMQGIVPTLSKTPGAIRSPGRPLGADNEDVFCKELGYDAADLTRWREMGVI
jgi:crotonobetainyl-CoA:carnitine CoA-transferase CaiB-like acyl-CoA transferase